MPAPHSPEFHRLEMENEILRQAAALFAKEDVLTRS